MQNFTFGHQDLEFWLPVDLIPALESIPFFSYKIFTQVTTSRAFHTKRLGTRHSDQVLLYSTNVDSVIQVINEVDWKESIFVKKHFLRRMSKYKTVFE